MSEKVKIAYNQEGDIYLIVQEKQVKMSIEEAEEIIKEMEVKIARARKLIKPCLSEGKDI